MLILPILFSLIIYGFACAGAGSIILRILSPQNEDSLSSAGAVLATRFLLGQGLLANLWVLISLTGNFSPLLVKSIITLLFISGILLNYKLLISIKRQFSKIWHESISETWGWKLLMLATLTLWLAWVASIGRAPTADGTGFYLPLAKVTSDSQRLMPLPGYEDLTSLGMQGEMHFAALMSMGSPESIQLFMWLTMTAGSILLLALGRHMGLDRREQWLAFAMLFTSTAVIELSGSGKTDLFAAALAFAVYYWAFNIQKENWLQASVLTGLLGGLALVAKVSYAVSFLPSLGIILVWKIFAQDRQGTLPSRMLPFVYIGLSAVFAVLPHLIKNHILFENVLAPFGMPGIVNQTWYGPDTVRRILVSLPLALTFGQYWAQIGGITPLIVMFAPLLFFLPKPQRPVESPLVILSLAALTGLGCWLIYRPEAFAPRYFLGCLLLLILPTAKAAQYFSSQGAANRRIVLIGVMLNIFITLSFYSSSVFVPKQSLQFIMSGTPDCEVEAVNCEITNNINPLLEPGERIFMNDPFRYWLRPDLIQCALTTTETENYLALETPEQRWRFIVGRGFTSVLIYNRHVPLSVTIKEDLEAIPDWLNVTVHETHELLIFLELTPLDDQHPGLYGCKQLQPPAWDVYEILAP